MGPMACAIRERVDRWPRPTGPLLGNQLTVVRAHRTATEIDLAEDFEAELVVWIDELLRYAATASDERLSG